MKRSLIVIFILLFLLGCSRKWQYLAQEPPGEKPEIFAEGIISGKGRIHSYPAISENGKQILWMNLPPKIWEVHFEKGNWSEPTPYEPTKDIVALRPGFHPDGTLIFSSAQIQEGFGNLDLWYLDNELTPKNLGHPVNTKHLETCQSFTDNGDIYYTSYIQGKKWDRGIVTAKRMNGKFLDPHPLPETINTPDKNTIDYLSFVSPDDSFILFSSNRHNTKNETCRLYVSFKDEDGIWNNAIDLNRVMGYFNDSRDPALSPDGKYLFFSSGENMMWISTSIIEKVRDENEKKTY